MSKTKQTSSKGRKRAARGIALCFVATVVLTGAYTWTNFKNQVEQKLDVAEVKEEEITPTEETSGKAYKAEEPVGPEDLPEKKVVSESVVKPNFTDKNQILWPVDGNVIMSYSMDRTVYFKTLDQYKYNPALIIAGKEDDQVIAAAAGVVKSIDICPQTGTTVTMDMGNGYECIYGQLKNVQVRNGEYIAAGSVVGYLDSPTKYYSLEGCNLYFEMRKDSQPVNPVEFVEGE